MTTYFIFSLLVNFLGLAALSVCMGMSLFVDMYIVMGIFYLLLLVFGRENKDRFQVYDDGGVYLITDRCLYCREDGEIIEFKCKRDAKKQAKEWNRGTRIRNKDNVNETTNV